MFFKNILSLYFSVFLFFSRGSNWSTKEISFVMFLSFEDICVSAFRASCHSRVSQTCMLQWLVLFRLCGWSTRLSQYYDCVSDPLENSWCIPLLSTNPSICFVWRVAQFRNIWNVFSGYGLFSLFWTHTHTHTCFWPVGLIHSGGRWTSAWSASWESFSFP